MALLIKNANIVSAKGIAKECQDILIEKGIIEKIASKIPAGDHKVIDATGKLVLPGLIDLHCHLREPGQEHKETIETGSKSAAKGGFTTIFCMPNTRPPIDNAKIIEGILKEVRRVGLVNIIPVGAVTKGQNGEELTDIFELKEAGCLAISDDGKSVSNSQLIRHALEYAKMANILLMEHCEDPTFSHGVMNEGSCSTLLGLKGIPDISESIIVSRDIELVRYLKTKIHFSHISSARSVELIRVAKSQGIEVTAEACPHHFSLTENDVESFNTNTKVNPPLKARADIDAIKQGLKDGTIDCISTDHAPHTAEDKELEFDCAPFGMIGFETALGLAIKELVETKVLTWGKLVERMAVMPAKISGLTTKGEISEGKDADIVIIDPDKEWVFEESEIVSKSKNSPFIGKKLKGCVETTICGGKISYQVK
ncbi:MAG: dihydroorotase [Candidatus Omnitrophica bacterium]|nr:dihydroorotase [Candidatus Omnitrophota bacterium]